MKFDTISLDFLNKHRIGALSTLNPDGSPHNAVMHYANGHNGELYFMTEKTGKKSLSLLNGSVGKASFATGFSDEEWATLQMDGEIRVVKDADELQKIYNIYFQKNPFSEKHKTDADTLFLIFTPLWYRYTEYKPKFKVITSEK
jgi:general stress protein 26